MKAHLIEIITKALDSAIEAGEITSKSSVILEKPKKEEFGDFSTNLAMILAGKEKKKPRDLAEILASRIEKEEYIKKCEIAGPGFINIFLEDSYWSNLLYSVLDKGDSYGETDFGKGEKVQVEFVSANPTGPLHIGHGRGAAVGDSLSRILICAGFDVTREYYINDVGNQMNTLGISLFLRYQELLGNNPTFPEEGNFYKGEYIKDIAGLLKDKVGDKYNSTGDCPEDNDMQFFINFAKDNILEGIKTDLKDFSVGFDNWYSERNLHDKNLIEKTIKEVTDKGFIYEKDGATWFKTTDFKDDKDRVLKKSDGSLTYFAADIAYHKEKIERGFSKIIDIWGADHHGYEQRVRSLFKALGKDDNMLSVIFIQLVSLIQNGESVSMSTRAGKFVTLKEVMDDVGADACRFFFLMRKSDAQLDFDLDLAKREAPENPVFYVQYCHARICSILKKSGELKITVPTNYEPQIFNHLTLREEIALIKHVGLFEDVINKSAEQMEPHKIPFYLTELASKFHSFYNSCKVLSDNESEKELSEARLLLCLAVAQVVKKGLSLVGVSAPQSM